MSRIAVVRRHVRAASRSALLLQNDKQQKDRYKYKGAERPTDRLPEG
jgi:hypothetical protein